MCMQCLKEINLDTLAPIGFVMQVLVCLCVCVCVCVCVLYTYVYCIYGFFMHVNGWEGWVNACVLGACVRVCVCERDISI